MFAIQHSPIKLQRLIVKESHVDAEQRPTKKQRELLNFINGFVKGYGYGPSYREIMRALGYKSVSTVAIHVNNLIAKGYLARRDKSARSLEITHSKTTSTIARAASSNTRAADHIDWLMTQAEAVIAQFTPGAPEAETIMAAIVLLGYGEEAAELKSLQSAQSDQ